MEVPRESFPGASSPHKTIASRCLSGFSRLKHREATFLGYVGQTFGFAVWLAVVNSNEEFRGSVYLLYVLPPSKQVNFPVFNE